MTEIERIIEILKKYALENCVSHYDNCAKAIEQYVIKARKEWEKELMSELKDPNGTIWKHAKYLQDENDRLKAQLKKKIEEK